MANTKISDLPGTTTLTDEDAIPVVQEGVTKKITGVLTALKTLLGIGNPETLQTQSKQVVGAVNELNGKSPFVEFHSQDVDLAEGINDIYVSGYPKDGFDQYLLSGYAFLSDATTTPLCGTVDSSGRFRMLVNCSRDRAATAIRYYILYIPSS